MPSLAWPHKNAPPELKSSYYGIYAISAVVVIVIAVNVFGNFSLKRDHDLEGQVQAQHDSIEEYASSHNKLPDIIADVGTTDSKGVDYKKLSDSRYMLCATFKTKSNGFKNYPVGSDLLQGSNLNLQADTKFSNGDTDYLKHDKGYTCIYYENSSIQQTPVTRTNPLNKGVTPRCEGTQENYPYRLSAIIQSVDITNSTIYLENTGQYIFDGSGNTALSPKSLDTNFVPQQTVLYSGSTVFYDTNCKIIKPESLAAKQYIYVYKSYISPTSTYANLVEVSSNSAAVGLCPGSTTQNCINTE